jgi:hypothetical protein
VYQLDRTHPLRDDLDWLPRELKALRWSTTGATWAGATGLALAATIASAGMLAHVAAGAAAAGLYAGARLGRSLTRRRLERLARGRLDLVRVGGATEGRLVHVAGRVIARANLPSFLHAVPSVYRRMSFRLSGTRFVHEAAVDFDLVDAAGERLRVHVAGARLFVPAPRDLADYPAALFTRPDLPPSLAAVLGPRGAEIAGRRASVPAAEIALCAGALVDVIGYKTETPDPTAEARMGRGPPMRPALQAGRVPLIVTPAAPVEPPDTL